MKNCLLKFRLNQNGLTLAELLVATAVGLILMTGIYQIFLSSDTGYRYNEQLSRLQENGRFVLDLISRDARMADFWGCAGQTDSYTSILNSSDFIYDFDEAIHGLESTGTNTWADDSGTVDPTSTGSSSAMGLTAPLSGSDILVLRGVDPNVNIEVTHLMTSVSAELQVTPGLSSDGLLDTGGGDILMITDCTEATVFQSVGYTDSNGNLVHNTGGSVSPGNTTNEFGHTYDEDAEVLMIRTVVYFVRANAAGEPALYRRIEAGPAEELIAGIENMQLLYGEDTDGDRNVDVYRTANNVNDWSDIVAIRIGLLVRSPQEIAKKDFDTANYLVNGTTIDPQGNGSPAAPVDDRRLRQVFTTTIGIRNRLP